MMRNLPEPDMRVVFVFFSVLAAVMAYFQVVRSTHGQVLPALLVAAVTLGVLFVVMRTLTKKRRAL